MTERKRKATDITQNPYIDLVDSSDDEEDDNQPDARIFPAPPGYPKYLRPRDEIPPRMDKSSPSKTKIGKEI